MLRLFRTMVFIFICNNCLLMLLTCKIYLKGLGWISQKEGYAN